MWLIAHLGMMKNSVSYRDVPAIVDVLKSFF